MPTMPTCLCILLQVVWSLVGCFDMQRVDLRRRWVGRRHDGDRPAHHRHARRHTAARREERREPDAVDRLHELRDAAHATPDEGDAAADKTLVLYATLLDDSALARAYGFRDDDVLTISDDARTILVRRGPRSWALCASTQRPAVVTMQLRQRVSDALRVADADRVVCAPNAPFLTSDVWARFDARVWRQC